MSAVDLFQYEMSSMQQGIDDKVVKGKNWVYVNDNNNMSYGSNTLNFDLSTLYNANKFIGVNEMLLQLPLVMVMSVDTQNQALAQNDFALALKSGYYNLVDSMNVVYDGQTVQQACTHSNFYTSFKVNSSMCVDDLYNIGPSLGIYPDNSTSWAYSTTVGIGGVGLQNNKNVYAALDLTADAAGDKYNDAIYKRQKKTAVSLTKYNTLTTNLDQNAMRNYCTSVNVANAAQYQIWYVTATIRLADLSSFFAKMGLTRGFYSRLTINLNLGSLKLTKAAANASITTDASQMNFPNQTCPFMVAPITSGLYAHADFTEVVCGIYLNRITASVNCTTNHSSFANAVAAHKLGAARIYAPMYELQPERAIKYIQENQNKYIEYEDLQYTPVVNISAGANISQNITNSAIDPIGVLVIPMLSASANAAAGTYLLPYSSPFTCEPACTSPVQIGKFNILLGGENVYPSPIDYDFEMYLQNILGVNSINGNQVLGLSSGLISEIDWNNIYKYYYVDLSRRAHDSVTSKSIQVVGMNTNVVPIDLHVFVISRKSVVINVDTGKLQSQSQ
jgi:hypothetical protein